MGLKFKKFRAKLNWKTKETVPQVVCLRYQINSEFEDILSTSIPATSSEVATRLRTNDVIKKQTPPSMPPVQHIFESTFAPANITTNNVSQKTETQTTNQNEVPTTASTKPKGILKKSNENLAEETTTAKPESHNNIIDADDYKKSALIFMTEDHDYRDVPDVKKDADSESNLRGITQLAPEVAYIEHDELKLKTTDSKKNEEREEIQLSFGTESDEELTSSDSKMVNWRQTIEYYSDSELEPNKQNVVNKYNRDLITNNQQDSDFTIHFSKHQNFATKELESEDGSEIDESGDETEVDTYSGSRGAYSSQAASIFFAGEEPEPSVRVRNITLHEDNDSSAA